MSKANIITGLDIGSSSIKALSVIKNQDSSGFEVLAKVVISSFGVRKGVVVNVEEVAKNISQVIHEIQSPIDQNINSVFVNIGGSHIFTTHSHGAIAVSRADQKISQEDIERVTQAAQDFSLPSNREVLEIFPREFIVDNQGRIKDVLEMQGIKLEIKILALCGFTPYLRSLTEAISISGLQINDLVVSGLASSKAVLTSQQKELGVALLDIGAGSVDLTVFEEGELIHLAVFPLGSAHITNDIAIGLKTEFDIAEKIKKEFGSCLLQNGQKHEKIKRPESEEPLIFSRKMLVNIIEARVSEIFDEVRKELKKISRHGLLPGGLVLTGGGSNLSKIIELAKKELKLPCQIGVPRNFVGLEQDPSLATVCGLILSGAEFENDQERIFNFKQKFVNRLKKIFKIFIP